MGSLIVAALGTAIGGIWGNEALSIGLRLGAIIGAVIGGLSGILYSQKLRRGDKEGTTEEQ